MSAPLPFFVHTGFTPFEVWALSQAVPRSKLPALRNPSRVDLGARYYELDLDEGFGTEEEIANALIAGGVLDYLSEKRNA
ncbi:MAG: hypothetical protein ACE14M_11015 [Terriglobales bacterium]